MSEIEKAGYSEMIIRWWKTLNYNGCNIESKYMVAGWFYGAEAVLFKQDIADEFMMLNDIALTIIEKSHD